MSRRWEVDRRTFSSADAMETAELALGTRRLCPASAGPVAVATPLTYGGCRDEQLVPQQQRGEPAMCTSVEDGRGFQNPIPSPLNPVELAGRRDHGRPMAICMQPSHTDRDTRAEVESV